MKKNYLDVLENEQKQADFGEKNPQILKTGPAKIDFAIFKDLVIGQGAIAVIYHLSHLENHRIQPKAMGEVKGKSQ